MTGATVGLAALAFAGLILPIKPRQHYVRMAPPAPAPLIVRPWRPTGAAVGVTGAVTLGPEVMTAAGAAFPIRSVGARGNALIFQVTAPMNPPLVNRSHLCGRLAPTWIVAAPIPPSGLELAVFAGPAAPKSADSPGVCATYFYNR